MKQILLLAAWTPTAALIFSTLGPVSDRPQLGHPQLERFTAFMIVGVCWAAAHMGRLRWVLVGLLLVAIALEAAQAFVPGRDPGLTDALAKGGGVVAGVAIIALTRRLASREA